MLGCPNYGLYQEFDTFIQFALRGRTGDIEVLSPFEGFVAPLTRFAFALTLLGGIFLTLNVHKTQGVLVIVWLEREISAGIQQRIGPEYVGPLVILQALTD
ncbi:hypothetical protein Goshw_003513 [Gossypium schwendimanii]|uniref:Uncharacterized protein n=1 Tax=Gossypium schwendimanii TaxID=34291 RepID=A0A7J9KW52_GOSSC|nr:hypothetical protein [Gossypium schwendimanii]